MQAATILSEQVSLCQALEALGVPRSSYYRAQQPKPEATPRPQPPRALSEAEKVEVRDVLNSERFCDASPRQVYATLLDEGRYVCHWRTMYRILAEYDEVRERRGVLRHPQYKRPELLATAPNELWSWDITKLRGPEKWTYYYLYVLLDVFSRYVVGWMIARHESSVLAKELIETSLQRQGIDRDQLVIHSDRGPSMMSKTVAQLLVDLGVEKSHSRPHVSNDNPKGDVPSPTEAQFFGDEIPTRLSRSLWLDRRCPVLGAGVFPVVQRRASSHGAGFDAACGGALRAGRGGSPGAWAGALWGLPGASGAIRWRVSRGSEGARGGLDQQAGSVPGIGGGSGEVRGAPARRRRGPM